VSACSGVAFQPAHCTVSLKNLTAASLSSCVLRETFKVNLWLMRCLMSSQFVCVLLNVVVTLCNGCAVSLIETPMIERSVKTCYSCVTSGSYVEPVFADFAMFGFCFSLILR
jgi:hypothetical protein